MIDIYERVETEILCEQSEEYRNYCIAMCAQDVVYFINHFCWTFDPRNEGLDRYLPFLLYGQQEEYARFLHDHIRIGRSCGVEKSRDMGATWITLAVMLHGWLFEYGYVGIVGSVTEDDIDKKDAPSCLMWKLDFMIKNLPDWMKPAGFNWKTHRTFCKLSNPVSGSTITGEVVGPNFGRSGRAKAAFFDELAHCDMAESAWNSCSATTKCRIACSTPSGMNYYGRLMNPEGGRKGVDKFTMHWKDDDRKNEWIAYDQHPKDGMRGNDPEFLAIAKELGRGAGHGKDAPRGTKYLYYDWYEYQKFEVYDLDIAWLAQEVDIDYKRSVKGRVYTQFDHVKRGRFFYDPSLPTYTAWDFGADATSILFIQWNWRNQRYRVIDYVEASDKLIDFFVPFITGIVPTGSSDEYTAAELEIIRRHGSQGWKFDGHFGDPSGKQTNQVIDVSVIETLQGYGIEVVTNDYARRFSTRIMSAKKLLLRCDVDEVNCARWIQCMENYRWPTKPEGHNSTNTNLAPVHDKWSHGATAWEYFAVNNPHANDQPRNPDGDYDREDILETEDGYDQRRMAVGPAGY